MNENIIYQEAVRMVAEQLINYITHTAIERNDFEAFGAFTEDGFAYEETNSVLEGKEALKAVRTAMYISGYLEPIVDNLVGELCKYAETC